MKQKAKKRKNGKRKKVLCVCSQGLNRSRYLAGYLKNKGYNTKYGGASIEAPNPIHQKDIDWADVIIIVRKRLVPVMKQRFHVDGKRKKLIVFNVTDSPISLFFERKTLKFMDYLDFQRKWTYPQLRKNIENHLPL